MPCTIAGDWFHPIVLTPYGGWWRWGDRGQHDAFIRSVAHSGDEVPDYDVEAERFDHDARTWSSWTHTAFIRQMVACAVAVDSYGGVCCPSLPLCHRVTVVTGFLVRLSYAFPVGIASEV